MSRPVKAAGRLQRENATLRQRCAELEAAIAGIIGQVMVVMSEDENAEQHIILKNGRHFEVALDKARILLARKPENVRP